MIYLNIGGHEHSPKDFLPRPARRQPSHSFDQNSLQAEEGRTQNENNSSLLSRLLHNFLLR